MTDQPFQTEFEFTLPQGYVDSEGTRHRNGKMRLATAADEIDPLNDPRVENNASYLTILLLARVIIELGDLENVNRRVIERLFVKDLEYLQNLYARINNQGSTNVETACPECGYAFAVDTISGRTGDAAGAETAPAATADTTQTGE